MCKIKTILNLFDKFVYRENFDVELSTISSIDVPSGCIVKISEQNLDIQYVFPTSTEDVAMYPIKNKNKINFEYGKISGKIHRFTTSQDELLNQTDSFRIIKELIAMSDSERFQGNISGFLRLSCDLVTKAITSFQEKQTMQDNL